MNNVSEKTKDNVYRFFNVRVWERFSIYFPKAGLRYDNCYFDPNGVLFTTDNIGKISSAKAFLEEIIAGRAEIIKIDNGEEMKIKKLEKIADIILLIFALFLIGLTIWSCLYIGFDTLEHTLQNLLNISLVTIFSSYILFCIKYKSYK